MKIATHQAINLFLFSLKLVKKAKKRAIGLLLSPIKLMTNKYFFWKQISCEETKIVSKFFRKLSYQNQFQKQRPDLKLSMASHVFCCVFFFLPSVLYYCIILYMSGVVFRFVHFFFATTGSMRIRMSKLNLRLLKTNGQGIKNFLKFF